MIYHLKLISAVEIILSFKILKMCNCVEELPKLIWNNIYIYSTIDLWCLCCPNICLLFCRASSHDNNSLGQKNIEGDLCGLLSNQGFSRQRKRSVIPNSKDTSSFRLVARFRRFSTPDSQDSE